MRIVLLFGLVVCFLAAETSSKPAITIPTPADYITDGISRLLTVFRNPNLPFGRTIRKIKELTDNAINHKFKKVETDFERDFDSSNETQQLTDVEPPKSDPKALNPVVGAIQTVGDLAQLLVAVGQQVLPGLIAGIAANNPAAAVNAGRSFEHGGLLRSLIGGLSGDDGSMGMMGTENETKYRTSVEM